MTQLAIASVEAFEGPAVQYIGDDGYPVGYCLPTIIARSADGCLFQLPQSFRVDYDEDGFQITRIRFDLQKAKDIAAEVESRRWIDEQHWVRLTENELRDYLCGGYSA